jgi:hypothetical protein
MQKKLLTDVEAAYYTQLARECINSASAAVKQSETTWKSSRVVGLIAAEIFRSKVSRIENPSNLDHEIKRFGEEKT